MRELGHVEGKDFVVEWRFAEGRSELFPSLAADRARTSRHRRGGNFGVGPSGTAGEQLVASLARPGGNVTGLANLRR
jgi:putative ABC transport system substrate-binding protein